MFARQGSYYVEVTRGEQARTSRGTYRVSVVPEPGFGLAIFVGCLAVAAIGRVSEVVEDINSTQATIAASVEEQTATTNEIAAAVADVATTSQEITENIAGVAGASQQTSSSANQTREAASGLSDLAASLAELSSNDHGAQTGEPLPV